MTTGPSDYRVHLFLLRLWCERLGEGQSEWRGEIKNTANGEVRYFRTATALHAGLLTLLDPTEAGMQAGLAEGATISPPSDG